MKFRKKPVVIEAIKYQAEFGNNRIANWLAQQGANLTGWLFFDGEIMIPTLEGSLKASNGDWIIRGTAGEFYPCKPQIFVEIYEPVDNSQPSAVSAPETEPTAPLGVEAPQQAAPPEESGTSEATSTNQACANSERINALNRSSGEYIP